MTQRFLGIIPARYASSRFPGKPLASLGGKPMIQWVWERSSRAFNDLVVATDDQRIRDAVSSFGGRVVMTSSAHDSGTSRCAEALDICEKESASGFTHVVNIQGDEPLIDPAQLEALKSCFSDPETRIATLVAPIEDMKDVKNPNVVKAVLDAKERALYFSRAAIPVARDMDTAEATGKGLYLKHIGLYGFEADCLRSLVGLPPSALEKSESLEQLRWLFHGYVIQTRLSRAGLHGVDTPGDLEALRRHIAHS